MNANTVRAIYRSYSSGQIVQARILKRRWFMRLLMFGVQESWDGGPPYHEYTKMCWRPSWRVLEVARPMEEV